MLNQPSEFWQRTVWPALATRLVLVANHLLAANSAATARLRAHAGKCVQVSVAGLAWPTVPPLLWRITPAGLVEATEEGSNEAAPDLRVVLPADQPLERLAEWAREGFATTTPTVHVEGDSALATDVSWVLAQVRWDAAADMERALRPLLGDSAAGAVAHGAAQVGGAVLGGMKALAGWLASQAPGAKPGPRP